LYGQSEGNNPVSLFREVLLVGLVFPPVFGLVFALLVSSSFASFFNTIKKYFLKNSFTSFLKEKRRKK
jgi:hypothetical protein